MAKHVSKLLTYSSFTGDILKSKYIETLQINEAMLTVHSSRLEVPERYEL